MVLSQHFNVEDVQQVAATAFAFAAILKNGQVGAMGTEIGHFVMWGVQAEKCGDFSDHLPSGK
jgi:hypothetical protein